MDLKSIETIITNYGFPVLCVIGLAWFALYMVKQAHAANAQQQARAAADMEQVQKRCKEREDKLYEEIKQNREINAKAIETIAHYAEKLDNIQEDVRDIKTDITIIKARRYEQ